MFGTHGRFKAELHFPNQVSDPPTHRAVPLALRDVGGLVGGIRLAAVVTAGAVALAGWLLDTLEDAGYVAGNLTADLNGADGDRRSLEFDPAHRQ
jgi:hypothetical protein